MESRGSRQKKSKLYRVFISLNGTIDFAVLIRISQHVSWILVRFTVCALVLSLLLGSLKPFRSCVKN